MSIFQKKTIIESFPAFDIVELTEQNGAINLKDGDELYCLKTSSKYMIGSVISSALKNGDDPIEARDRAIGFGHDLHFIFALGSSLTSHKRPRKTYISIKIGQRVHFEGKYFEITKTGNNNRGLVEVK